MHSKSVRYSFHLSRASSQLRTIYKAPASLRRVFKLFFLAWRSEFPPMCSLAMKMLGTVVWPVISPRVDWIAEPSSVVPVSLCSSQPNSDSSSRNPIISTTLMATSSVYPHFPERRDGDSPDGSCIRTNLIQLNRIKLCAALAQKLLCLAAVRAVALAEDGDGVLVNDGLNLGLGGGHGGGRGGAREVAAQEGNGGGVEWV
jgi:hypothetical protein